MMKKKLLLLLKLIKKKIKIENAVNDIYLTLKHKKYFK
jgi:hypothetical protein